MKFNFKKIALVILALIIAVILWLHVITEREYETDMDFQLVVENVPPKYMIANPLPQNVHIRIRGRGKDLIAQQFAEGKAIISLENFSYGRKTITLSQENLRFISSEIELVEVLSPREIEIYLDRRTTREVPVKSRLTVIPADGMYCPEPPKLKPSVVTLEGPESKLLQINSIYTVQETLRGFNIFTTFLVPLERPDELVRPIPDTISVLVQVAKLAQRRIENISIKLVNFPRMAGAIEPSMLDVIISGPGDKVEKIAPEQIEVYVNYNDIKEEKDTDKIVPIKPTVIVPDEVQVIGTDPESVRFIPRKK
ncbi:hypothetical protein DRQ33_06265 [bacterium]|nr:MAG: hypothetical protein DRQ33_06265 [bacterium]